METNQSGECTLDLLTKLRLSVSTDKSNKRWIPSSLLLCVFAVNLTRAGWKRMRRRVVADEKRKTQQYVAGEEQGRRPWLRRKDIPANFNGAEDKQSAVVIL
jgi:hypothetical protein